MNEQERIRYLEERERLATEVCDMVASGWCHGENIGEWPCMDCPSCKARIFVHGFDQAVQVGISIRDEILKYVQQAVDDEESEGA